jgi:hypothetical protein
MQIEVLVSDGVTVVLSPENEMEEALLKQLMKQSNDITEIRSTVMLLNKTYRSGIVIGKTTNGVRNVFEHDGGKPSTTTDEDQTKEV